jgi:hypothetical protein
VALARLVHPLVYATESAAEHLAAPPQTVVLAGSGEFLANLVVREQKAFSPRQVISLAERLGPGTSSAACAHAVGALAGFAESGHPVQ